MVRLDQVWGMRTLIRKCEEITLWPEILWHDAMYHEADHYLKWPCSANVRILWSQPPEGAVILWMSCFNCCNQFPHCDAHSFLSYGGLVRHIASEFNLPWLKSALIWCCNSTTPYNRMCVGNEGPLMVPLLVHGLFHVLTCPTPVRTLV